MSSESVSTIPQAINATQMCIENTMEDEKIMTTKIAPRYKHDVNAAESAAARVQLSEQAVEDFDDECEKYLATHPDFMRTMWQDRLVQRQTGLLEKHMQMTQRQHQDLTMAIKQVLSMHVDGLTKQMQSEEQEKEYARDRAQKEAQDKLDLALTLLNERSERIVEQLKTGANFEAALKATVAEIASSSRQRDEANKENCCHHQHKNGASSPSSSSAGVAVAGLKSELKLVQRQLDEVLTKAVTMRTDAVLQADKGRPSAGVDGGDERPRPPAGSRVQIGGYYDGVRAEVDALMAEARSIKWAFDGDRSLLKMLDLEKGTMKGKKEASPLMRPKMRKPPAIPYFGARVAVGSTWVNESPQGFAAAQASVPGYGISSKKPAYFDKLKATERVLRPKVARSEQDRRGRTASGDPTLKSIRNRMRQQPKVTAKREVEGAVRRASPTVTDKAVSTASVVEQQQHPEWDDTVLGCEIPREPPPVRKRAPPPPPREKVRRQKGKVGASRKAVGKRKMAPGPTPTAKWDAVNDLVMLIPPGVAAQPRVSGLGATGSTLASTAEVPGRVVEARVRESMAVRSEGESLVERLMGKYGAASRAEESVLSELVEDILQGEEGDRSIRGPSGVVGEHGGIADLVLGEVEECLRGMAQRKPPSALHREDKSARSEQVVVDQARGVEAGVEAVAESRHSGLQTVEIERVESGVDPLPVLEEPPEGRREEAQRKAPAETHTTQTDAIELPLTRAAEVDDAAVSAHIVTASEGTSCSSSLRVSNTEVVESVATTMLLGSSGSSLPDLDGQRSPGEIRQRRRSVECHQGSSLSEGEIRQTGDATGEAEPT